VREAGRQALSEQSWEAYINTPYIQWTGLKHETDQETDQKTDYDKLQIQGLEQNLHQLCHVASKIIFCCEWFESSSERYFMD